MATAVISTDDSRQALIVDEFGTGWQRWNLQAWLDFVMVKILMGSRRRRDPQDLHADPASRVRRRRQGRRRLRPVSSPCASPVRLLDSPREKWRKMYGSYIRELEWVYGELRQHFPAREYQDLVIDIMARTIRDWLGAFLPTLEAGTRGAPADGPAAQEPHAPGQEPSWLARKAARLMEKAVNGPIGTWFMNHLNPSSFMVGPVEMEMQPHGVLKMFVPRCWMHTAPCDGRTQDQACVQACKGACERIFGPDTMSHMIFEPHLPDYSCTMWIKLGGGEFGSDAINEAKHPANKA